MIKGKVIESLKAYVEIGRPTGGFLRAVLENKLSEAFMRADDDNVVVLRDIVAWIYWNIPADCWGSPEKVVKWIENKKKEREELHAHS